MIKAILRKNKILLSTFFLFLLTASQALFSFVSFAAEQGLVKTSVSPQVQRTISESVVTQTSSGTQTNTQTNIETSIETLQPRPISPVVTKTTVPVTSTNINQEKPKPTETQDSSKVWREVIPSIPAGIPISEKPTSSTEEPALTKSEVKVRLIQFINEHTTRIAEYGADHQRIRSITVTVIDGKTKVEGVDRQGNLISTAELENFELPQFQVPSNGKKVIGIMQEINPDTNIFQRLTYNYEDGSYNAREYDLHGNLIKPVPIPDDSEVWQEIILPIPPGIPLTEAPRNESAQPHETDAVLQSSHVEASQMSEPSTVGVVETAAGTIGGNETLNPPVSEVLPASAVPASSSQDSLGNVITRTQDEYQRTIQTTFIKNSDGSINQHEVIVYDTSGSMQKKTNRYYEQNNLKAYIETIYDALTKQPKLITQTDYNSDGHIFITEGEKRLEYYPGERISVTTPSLSFLARGAFGATITLSIGAEGRLSHIRYESEIDSGDLFSPSNDEEQLVLFGNWLTALRGEVIGPDQVRTSLLVAIDRVMHENLLKRFDIRYREPLLKGIFSNVAEFDTASEALLERLSSHYLGLSESEIVELKEQLKAKRVEWLKSGIALTLPVLQTVVETEKVPMETTSVNRTVQEVREKIENKIQKRHFRTDTRRIKRKFSK